MTQVNTEQISETIEAVGEAVEVNMIKEYFQTLPEKAFTLGIRVIFALFVLLIGFWLIHSFRKLIRKGLTKRNADKGITTFIDSLIKYGLGVWLVLGIAAYFGMDAASIVALLGSAGVAIGLAIQGSLSNLAGGVLILIVRPFQVGDYIHEDSKGNEGTVKEITIFYTKLLTPDNRVVVLPNGELANTSLTNFTQEDSRRIDHHLSVSYDTDIKQAKAVLETVLNQSEYVLKEKEHFAAVHELEDSAVVLLVRFWCATDRYWDAKWALLEECKLALDQANIHIPYPQVDVHFDPSEK